MAGIKEGQAERNIAKFTTSKQNATEALSVLNTTAIISNFTL